jgi:hypothetical protein
VKMMKWICGMRTARRAVTLMAVALLVPAAAHASVSVPSGPRLTLKETFKIGSRQDTLPNRQLEIGGTIGVYQAGQVVEIHTWLNGTPFVTRTVPLTSIDGQSALQFKTKLKVPRSGVLSIQVMHIATPELPPFRLGGKVDVLAPSVHIGSTGPIVKLIQQQLLALHFYLKPTGVYDGYTQLAVDAYHRLLGRGHSTLMDPGTLNDLLNGRGAFHVRFPNQGVHAEGDLSAQLLALTDGGNVQWILPISSGKPSTPTVLGSWQIYRRTPGYLPDGMYYSDFFTGGYAIHGYDPAPDYPASHGCMRLPITDAIFVYDWLKLGDWVDTYYT